jgi:hypothetical protein
MYLFLIFLLILVTASLLLVPFYLYFHFNSEGFSIRGFFKAKWFGLVLYNGDLPFPEGAEDRKVEENRKNAVDERSKPDHAWFPKDARVLIDVIPAFFRVLKGLTGSIHVEHASCKVIFGFDDPADTAVVSGYLWALTSAVSLPGTYIRVDPYFEGQRLAGSLNAEIRGRLLWLLIASINALREKPIRRLLKELLRDEMMSRKGPRGKWPLRAPRGKCH